MDKVDIRKSGLSLRTALVADAFLGRIHQHVYNSSDDPLFLFKYALKPAVELNKKHSIEGRKMMLMLAGRMTIQAGPTENWYLPEGKLCLFSASDYQIMLPQDSNVEYLVFNVDSLARRMELDGLVEGRYDLSAPMRANLAEIMEAPAPLPSPEKWLSRRLFNLLYQLSEDIESAMQQPNKTQYLMDFVLKADAFIRHNLLHDLTTPQIAENVGFNECGLKIAFKEHFGIGMAKRQNQLRIEMAKQLLLQSDISINEIALRCGYNSADTLRDNFKWTTKLNPADWRKKYKI